MRLWSLHPKYLDRQGLLAVWREGLLAQKVLRGKTRGYRNHPQLQRFKEQKDPLATIGTYLQGIHQEAAARGYEFDRSKILSRKGCPRIKVTSGQLEYEFRHLIEKLKARDPDRIPGDLPARSVATHPLFTVRPGTLEGWERKGSQ